MPTDERKRLCVLLLQLGGPADIAGIEPFLRNLFEDVLPLPRLFRAFLARRIAKKRAPLVAPQYEKLGGGSPILRHTDAQAKALEAELSRRGHDAKVLVVMRYAPPRASEALELARRERSDAEWVALPLYPQYSFATTRSSLDELTKQLTLAEEARLRVVSAYPEDTAYLDAMAGTVQEALAQLSPEQRAGAQLVFSAHGLPESLVKAGDPYPEHVQKTVAGMLARLPAIPHHLAFQSKVGRARWLQPSLLDTVRALGAKGAKTLVVVPVSFVSEHIETLIELDEEVLHAARLAGVETYVRAQTVMARPRFIEALAGLVDKALEG